MRLSMLIWVYLSLCAAGAAATGGARADDTALCRAAVASVERDRHIPDSFLSAIARVESGRADPQTGTLAPWPWTINAEGTGAVFASKAEAMAAVRGLQARGVRSIDVGCLQVNLMFHPEAFASLDHAFDPLENATYAADLLLRLLDQTGSWPRAAAAYHSQTPPLGAAYQKRVLAEWAIPDAATPADQSRFATGRTPRSSLADQLQPSPRGPVMARDEAAVPVLPVPSMNGSLFVSATPKPRVIGLAAQGAPGSVGAPATGRSLAAYRMMPTLLAFRPTPRRAARSGPTG